MSVGVEEVASVAGSAGRVAAGQTSCTRNAAEGADAVVEHHHPRTATVHTTTAVEVLARDAGKADTGRRAGETGRGAGGAGGNIGEVGRGTDSKTLSKQKVVASLAGQTRRVSHSVASEAGLGTWSA